MNAFVLHTTIVCLAIAVGVKCKIGDFGADTNHLQHGTKYYVSVNTPQHHLFNIESPDEYMRQKCLENSRKEDAFETLQKDIQDIYSCLNTRNVSETFLKLRAKDSDKNLVPILKELCTKSPDLKYCKKTHPTSFLECFNDSEKLFITIFKHMSAVLGTFLCQNDAERITALFSDSGKNCIKNRSRTLEQCFETLGNKSYFPKTSTNYKILNFDSVMASFKFNREQCNDLRELKLCVVDDLRHCDQPSVANIVDSGFELAFRHSPCLKFVTKINEIE